MSRLDRTLYLGGALLIGLYFLLLVQPSLGAYFSPDDAMNLYRSWAHPPLLLLKANLLFFWASPYYRPLPSAWYWSIFQLAGLNPLPYHVVYLGLFFVNLWLTYSVARRLSGSREVAVITTLLASYHHRLDVLFLDTGYIYDALCYLFYLGALLLYLRVRQQDHLPGAGTTAGFLLLYIGALNSKEIAVTLPAMILAYELIFHWPGRKFVRWVTREGRTTLLAGIVTVVFIVGRSMGPDSLRSAPGYSLSLTWRQFMSTSTHFAGELFRDGVDWPIAWVLILWAVLLGIACVGRSRVLGFAWLWLMLTPLPVAFVAPRGPAQYYIPWFGWVFYAATALAGAVAFLARHLNPLRDARVRGAVLIVALAAVLYPYYRHKGYANVTSITDDGPVARAIVEQLRALRPRIRPASRVLFLNDPIPLQSEGMAFWVRLIYEDDTIEVERAKKMDPPPTPAQLDAYNYRFDYQAGYFFDWSRTRPLAPAPRIVWLPEDSGVYHDHLVRVTSAMPARPGEVLTGKVTDLGAPDPSIEVRVNGKKAEVLNQTGWAGEANRYRVDFRVPAETAAGLARLEIAAEGLRGPAMTIPVAVSGVKGER